ncbi:polymorphic toxin type 15 domain-containing protein [Ruania halotolerans]|uniref:polymorphic toxin type 15 domain-containing protein n=1 Tax=Ruania halotolerans TaxID=2897773 RepID=UPI001E580A5C|nr:polymorphic toxin type 15 domain-containing protein [Ruania halotolerans]UFU06279.1 polymorphic toxin type 15 domain-containing protein [Ruania halotolerans]
MSMARHMDEVIEALGTGSRRIARALDGRSKLQRQEILDNIRRIRDRDTDLAQRSSPQDLPAPNGDQARRLADLEAQGLLSRNTDGTYRMSEPESPDPFTRNPDHDAGEFADQLAMQQNGLNRLSIREYLDNRANYDRHGRQDESLQSLYRDELRRAGYDVKGMAVLHGPDQIAGGHPYRVDGLGDSGVNSSFGAQWKDRARDLQTAIEAATAGIPSDLLPQVRVNVTLPTV